MHMPVLNWFVETDIFGTFLDLDELLRRVGEAPVSGLLDHHEVFDSNTADALNIHAVLDGDDRISNQRLGTSGANGGHLVDVYPHSVTNSVRKELAETVAREDLACRQVYLHAGYPRPHRRQPGLVGLKHRIVATARCTCARASSASSRPARTATARAR